MPGFLVLGLIVFELIIFFLILFIWLAIESKPSLEDLKTIETETINATTKNAETLIAAIKNATTINVVSILGKIALTIVLSWLGILMAYYGWIIYFYNYNFGRSQRFWENFTDRALALPPNGLKTENDLYEELGAPRGNPYAGETFGVPPGTVRGTLALSILVGATALTIIFFGEDHRQILPANSILHNYFSFFEDAFLMVVAFYFGTKGLDIIQRERTARIVAKNQGGVVSEEDVGLAPLQKTETPAKAASTPITANLFNPSAPPVVQTKDKIIEKNYPHVQDLEANRRLTPEDKKRFATEYNIEPATVEAVIKVESRGNGFLTDGRPIILFEGHVFWKQLKKFDIDPAKYHQEYPEILYPSWTKKFYKAGTGEYLRLTEAQKIHREAALCSASWGLFQVMGYHYKTLKYDSIDDFVNRQYESEYEHLEAFGRYIKQFNLVGALQEKDWRKFAKGYNGPGYEKNNYHLRLEEVYKVHKEA